MTTVKEILDAMHEYSPEDEALIRKAYAFAEKAHESVKRYSGEPYFIHPAAVAKHRTAWHGRANSGRWAFARLA
jgi:(p)ppGpp synthase/HD superfamily hydrolase